MTIVPAPKPAAFYHLFGLLDGERFRLPGCPDIPDGVYRVEHASTSECDTPIFVLESTGWIVPARAILERNGGSYFVLPIWAEKGAGS